MISTVTRHAPLAARPFAIAVAVAAAFPSICLAQATADKVLAPVVVTATRSEQAARDVLTDNIVISAEEIERSGQSTLVDLLQRQRGIEISRNGGPGTSSSVFMRGASNNQAIVLIDGVRSGSSTSGGATWSAIPLSQIERIEVVYGPLGTLYGADALGGVVQIFTKKGDGAPRLTASAGYGTYATRTLNVGVSGASEGEHRFTYAISAAQDRSDGFSATRKGNFSYNPDKDGYQQDSASGQFSYELAKGHELGLNFLYSRNDSQFDDGASAFDARGHGRLSTVALYSRNQLLPNWTSQLQVSQARDKSDSISEFFPSVFNSTHTNFSWQNDIKLGADLLQLIAERREEKAESTVSAVARTRDTNSFAVTYLLKRDAHLANLGIRNDHSTQYGSRTTGSAGYGYRITPALRVNASVGTSFRAPTFNELYYPQFGLASNKPESGRNAEAGLYHDDGKTQLSAVYFRNRITDLIVNTNPCPGQSKVNYPFGCAYNVNKALLTGITLGASTRLGNFSLRGSLDFLDARDETTDKRLARRARHHGSLGLDYGAGAIKAGAEAVFSGKRFDSSANTTVMGGYGLLNLYASYDLSRDWTLFGRWDNVLDKNYELARTYATPGSAVFVGVRYSMK